MRRATVVMLVATALAAPSACQNVEAVSVDGDGGDASPDHTVPEASPDVGAEAGDATHPDAQEGGVADSMADGPVAMGDADAGLDTGTDAPSDAADATEAADAADAADTGSDASDAAPDASSDTGAPGDAAADGACPGSAGPAPVRVGAYCVDSTEVTNQDYALFLAVDAGALAAQPAACAWNASFVPQGSSWPPAAGAESLPVVAVDWCDAVAYCAWAGKRLCGATGGGSVPYAAFADAAASQWFSACSGGGALAYPYGNTYDNTACNGADFPDADILRPVASLPACVGASPGLFDMSGNVFEWEDGCQGDGGAGDLCRIRGGSYFSFQPKLGCAADVAFPRSASVYGDIGFRCCSP